jgi:hypothetical protein
MKETAYEKLFAGLCKTEGAKCLNLHGHVFQAAGWPDHYVSSLAFRGWVEFKRNKGRLKGIQAAVIEDLLVRGDNVVVVRFWDEYDLISFDGQQEEAFYPAKPVNVLSLLQEKVDEVRGGLLAICRATARVA